MNAMLCCWGCSLRFLWFVLNTSSQYRVPQIRKSNADNLIPLRNIKNGEFEAKYCELYCWPTVQGLLKNTFFVNKSDPFVYNPCRRVASTQNITLQNNFSL